MSEPDLVINSVAMIDFEGATSNPSVVLYRKNTRTLIGWEAQAEITKEPGLFLNRDFKLALGEIKRRSTAPREKFPCSDGQTRSAPGIAADYLYQIVEKIRRWIQSRGPADSINVLVAEPLSLSQDVAPPEWLSNYRQNLQNILKGTPGIKTVDFLPEPFAVFQFYKHARRHPAIASTKHHALVNFGGGTCDVCIIETTKEGEIRTGGRHCRPLAAASHPTGGSFINFVIAKHLLTKFSNIQYSADLKKAFSFYQRWRDGEYDLTNFADSHYRHFVENLLRLDLKIEHVKLTVCRQIQDWNLDGPLRLSAPLTLPADPFSNRKDTMNANISAEELRSIFIEEVWPRVKSVISQTLKRGRAELEGAKLAVVLFSGGSANIGWLRHLLLRDFFSDLAEAHVIQEPDYQEVVAQGLSIECARRYFNPTGDFGSVTYNRLCLVLDADSRGVDVRQFEPRTAGLPTVKGLSGLLLPSASALKAFIDKPMTWRVRLDHPPRQRLDYYFMRSTLSPADTDNLQNVSDHTVFTPTKARFDSAIQLQLTVKEDGTAIPKFIYKDAVCEVTGKPFFLDMTFGSPIDGAEAYIGLDFGTSNTAASFVDRRAVEVWEKRSGEAQWRGLGDLSTTLPYPLAVSLRQYLSETEPSESLKRGREFIEAALCVTAYLAYLEFCTLKGSQESRLFKGFTHRSAGPLWALLRECLDAMGNRSDICRPLCELQTPQFFAAVDAVVNHIAEVKHDKAVIGQIDVLRPVTILANLTGKVFGRVAFGFFERVQKRAFAQNYEGTFRHACGTSPFVHIARYEGPITFSAEQAFAVLTEKGVAIPLDPLIFWDECDRHPELEGGHCFLFDKTERDGSCSFKAVGFSCSKRVSPDDTIRGELAKRVQELRIKDQRLNPAACGRLDFYNRGE
jgi:molecular chaperone DnaK (HSP70)